MARINAQEAGGQSVLAFLDLIAWSEGTSTIPSSDDGYNVIVGSTPQHPDLFTTYIDHPRVLVHLSPTLASTAAGRYQVLARFYDAYKKMLGLSNFGPCNQDRIALQIMKEVKAIDMVKQGNIDDAIKACSSRWASFPGGGYGQHAHDLQALLNQYQTIMQT